MATFPEPHTCAACRSSLIFTLGNYYSEKGWYESIDENYRATAEAYVFNVTYEQVTIIARQGCKFSMWLMALCRPDTHSKSYLRAYFANNSNEQMILDWVDNLDDHIDGGGLDRKLIICAEEDIAASEITYRPPNLLPSSEETIMKAKGWLQNCLTTHADCPKPMSYGTQFHDSSVSRKGPRRLVQLFGGLSHPKARLLESPFTFSPQYAALSYCWGGDQVYKLDKRNLEAWCIEMPYTRLPQTIKDAVQVTRGLGLEYLWVDALCIMQDSDSDKAEEISQMGDIYEQAHVTLSAARALAVWNGFLHSRYIPGERGFRIPFICSDGRLSSVVLWKGRDPDTWEPTHKRAWCLQESILSPRVLEYGTHTMRWHCAHTRKDISLLQFDGWVGKSNTFAHKTSHPLVFGIDWATLREPDYVFVQVWQQLVSHYTHLSIGWQEDKLLAISAIARKMSSICQRKYIAGLWREDMGELLMWQSNRSSDSEQTAARLSTYVAPSWSWASFAGRIAFSLGSRLRLLEVLEIQAVYQIPHDEFSAVRSARLRLRTLTSLARIRRVGHWPYLWDENLQKINGDLFLDLAHDNIDQDFIENEELLLALVTAEGAIVLRPQPDGKTYTRIGIYREGLGLNRPAWEIRDVEIV